VPAWRVLPVAAARWRLRPERAAVGATLVTPAVPTPLSLRHPLGAAAITGTAVPTAAAMLTNQLVRALQARTRLPFREAAARCPNPR
jgi:hypothetical protein